MFYSQAVTPQLLAFATAPARDCWIWIEDVGQTAAWKRFLGRHVIGGRPDLVQKVGVKTGFFAPWPFPPRIDGTPCDDGDETEGAA